MSGYHRPRSWATVWPRLRLAGGAIVVALLVATLRLLADDAKVPPPAPRTIDPAAWGEDHVGKPIPDFVTGGECLFCHARAGAGFGNTWQANRHQKTVRDPHPDDSIVGDLQVAADIGPHLSGSLLVLGAGKHGRLLRSSERGKFDLFSVHWTSFEDGSSKVTHREAPHWDSTRFGDRCAGCHTSAVDSETRTSGTPSIDCFTCHGEVPLEHANDTRLVYFGKKRVEEPRVVTSICAQCHIRTGKSKSSGLPYANNFVPGDNLFKDFQVDLSDNAIAALNPGERHVLENIRDVAIRGIDGVTCLSCHDVHTSSSKKHHKLPETAACMTCHPVGRPKREADRRENHSRLCEY